MSENNIETSVVRVLRASLALDPAAPLGRGTSLLGALPELDSLSLVVLLGALEAEFGFRIHDDEVDASVFTSVGSLSDFVAGKLGEGEGRDCSRSS